MGQLAFFQGVAQPSAFASWLTDGEERRIILLFFLGSLRIQLVNRRDQALLAGFDIAPDVPVALVAGGPLGILDTPLFGESPAHPLTPKSAPRCYASLASGAGHRGG